MQQHPLESVTPERLCSLPQHIWQAYHSGAVEVRHLRYFVAVAEDETVSRAALKLYISQPAVSRQIRDLEDEIGLALLNRRGKSVSLTPQRWVS